MSKTSRVIVTMILIMAIGMAIVFSTDKFSDTSDTSSIAYKIKHADVYVGNLLNNGMSLIKK